MQRSSARPLITLGVIVLATVLLILGLTGGSAALEAPFSVALAPLQSALSTVANAIAGATRGSSDVAELQNRLREAEAERDVLRLENVRLREFQAEVAQYRELLNFSRANPTYSVVGSDVIGLGSTGCAGTDPRPRDQLGVCASVIAGDVSPYLRYVVVNVGARDGVKVGMPVVGGGFGLVGRIGQVAEASSQVQLLVDTGSFINVQAVETRATGTVSGRTDGSLVLQNVPQTEELKVGDQLVTSGLSGALPRLLPVGTIDRITSTDAQLFKEAIVRPSVDFNRIETVLVLTVKP